MVELYSDMLVAAMAQHHETTDQWSVECDPLTGAMTCAATMPPMGDADASGHTNRLPSSLNDEDSRPDPPLEAHVELEDRCSFTALSDVPDGLSAAPTNHKEATRRPDWELWKAACLAEMNDLINSETIVLGRPPMGAKIVQAMFQYKRKSNAKGQPYKRKARFCARGDTYSAGPEVPIFAPTAPWVTVRSLLSLACANGYVVKTFDVKSAFTWSPNRGPNAEHGVGQSHLVVCSCRESARAQGPWTEPSCSSTPRLLSAGFGIPLSSEERTPSTI